MNTPFRTLSWTLLFRPFSSATSQLIFSSSILVWVVTASVVDVMAVGWVAAACTFEYGGGFVSPFGALPRHVSLGFAVEASSLLLQLFLVFGEGTSGGLGDIYFHGCYDSAGSPGDKSLLRHLSDPRG